MKKKLPALLSLLLLACAGGNNNPESQDNEEGSTDNSVITDNSATADNSGTDNDPGQNGQTGPAVNPYKEYQSQGGNGYLAQSAKNKAAYLYATSLNVPMDEDDKALAFPYDQLDLELYTEFGQNYPLKTGTYILGDSDSEKLFYECSKCVLYWPGTVENGDYDGTFFAVGGKVVVEEISAGRFKATFSDLLLERVVDDDFHPLSEEEKSYYREEELVITLPKAVIEITDFKEINCDTVTEKDDFAGYNHCTYNKIIK